MWTLEIQRAESPLPSTSLQVRIEWKQTEWPWRVDVNCISLAKRKSKSLCWEISQCVFTSKLSILLQHLGLRLCCLANSWNVKSTSNHANQQLHWFHKKLAALCCNATYFSTLASQVGAYGLIYWVIVVHFSRKKKKNDTVSWSVMNRLNFTKSSHVFVKCTCYIRKDWRYSRFYCLTSAVLLDKRFCDKKTIDGYEGYFITSSPEVFIVAHRNKHFKINLTVSRNLTGQRQTSRLFISLTKELNLGLPWTNQATCSRTLHVQCRTLVKHRVGLWTPGPSCSKGG